MIIEYGHYTEFPGWAEAPNLIKSIIKEYDLKNILEIGSGANPTIEPEYVIGRSLAYTTNDISEDELKKADSAYRTLLLDMSSNGVALSNGKPYDFIFSRMVNEHVKDGRMYYQNIYKLLQQNGMSFHCFSTLFALPFVLNRILPEFLSDLLLDSFAPRNRYRHKKFKAYYNWSRGPTRKMIQNFETIGFDVIKYIGYFGHGYYKQKLSYFNTLEMAKSKVLLKRPVPVLTSYASVLLKKT